MTIKKAAVIGSGVMGGGIAAHIANAGVPVVLLDIVPSNGGGRGSLAETAVQNLLKANPAAFMHPDNAKRVTTGNIEDDLGKLKDADWIVEVIVEDLAAKRDLYAKLEKIRKPGSIVSSNTSTIPLRLLTETAPESFARDFLVTHFFNPPRYMQLLEIVAGPKTRPEAADVIQEFADRQLGKGVVRCNDTPGFIANRIGGLWLRCGLGEAFDGGLTVEEADALNAAMGIPKSGIFGLLDLVGIDLIPKVGASMMSVLPPQDAYRKHNRDFPLIEKMIANGYTGRKGKGGFYRLNRDGGKKVKEAIDLKTGEYRPKMKPSLASIASAKRGGVRALVAANDAGGPYAGRVLFQTIAYAAGLIPEIANSVVDIDEAMRLGYRWRYGPFELADQLGAEWMAARFKAENMPVPELFKTAKGQPFYRVEKGRQQYLTLAGKYENVPYAEGMLSLADVKLAGPPIAKNASASLWNLGDGVACLEFHSKMNAIDEDVMAMLSQSMEIVGRDYKALVIYNDGENFSVGANIGLALFAANVALWSLLEERVEAGQAVYKALKYAPFPVVAAPSGMALGGGCEILLHSSAIQAHAELYTGLVEAGVGLLPGWGGCKEMVLRWAKNGGGPMPAATKSFETIALAKVSKSAFEAREMQILRPGDGITMNRARLLSDAKARALALAKNYKPPEPAEIRLPGSVGRAAIKMVLNGLKMQGKVTPHDMVVSTAIAEVVTGGDTSLIRSISEDDISKLERREFMRLLKTPETLARIEHILDTGKPLRN